jgi:NhaP-type Na+/H+ or K+/H+ antiporter
MSEVISVGAIVIYLMLLTYLFIGTIIERYELSFGHEASLTIMIGMLISYVGYTSGDDEFVKLLKFDDNTFFYVCLPPIVFASGFNMQRGNFFANFKTITLFGVIGTFVAFTSFSLLTIYLNNKGFM